MKEFISILISFILMGIADNIDNFFNNALSLDTIVVCGCLFTLGIVLTALSNLGLYAYRTIRKKEMSYLIINFISTIIIAVITFIARDYIVNIFDLTTYQKHLFTSIITIYIIYLPVERTSVALFEMIRLKGNLKLYNKSLLIYYISLILFDFLAFYFTKSLIFLFVATIIARFISIIYMLYKLKLQFTLPNKEDFNNVKKYSIPTLFERIITCGSTLIYTIIATRLGTHDYAIYTICFTIMINLEIVTDAYQSALMIKTPLNKPFTEQYKSITNLKQQCFKIALLFNYILCFIYLFISHGSLPLIDCLPYIFLFASTILTLYPYETYKTLCITQGQTTIMLKSALIGTTTSIILYLLFFNTSIALIIFGIAGFIEYGIKTIIVKTLLNKQFAKKPMPTSN